MSCRIRKLPIPILPERNPFAELGLATKQLSSIKGEDKLKSASPVTAWPTFEPAVPKPDIYRDSPVATAQDEEEWGDFADLPPETPAVANAKAASGIEADAWHGTLQIRSQKPLGL